MLTIRSNVALCALLVSLKDMVKSSSRSCTSFVILAFWEEKFDPDHSGVIKAILTSELIPDCLPWAVASVTLPLREKAIPLKDFSPHYFPTCSLSPEFQLLLFPIKIHLQAYAHFLNKRASKVKSNNFTFILEPQRDSTCCAWALICCHSHYAECRVIAATFAVSAFHGDIPPRGNDNIWNSGHGEAG